MNLRRSLMPLPLLLALVLSGCASLGAEQAQLEPIQGPRVAVELTKVPFHPQERYLGGPAALAAMLGWSGAAVTPEDLDAKLADANREDLQSELQAQARQYQRLSYRIPASVNSLLDELAAGHPVMVLQDQGMAWWPAWRYAVVIGHDPARGEFILRSGPHKRHVVTEDAFMRSWQRGHNWGLVVLPPGTIPASADPAGYLTAAFELEQAAGAKAAAVAYWAGLERWPADPGLSLALSNVHYGAGQLQAAESTLRIAIRDGADSGILLNNLAWLLAEQQRWDEAEVAAASAVTYGGEYLGEFRDTLQEIRCRRGSDECPAAGH